MSSDHPGNLSEKVRRLQADRQRHFEAMVAIDRVLADIDHAFRTLGEHGSDGPTDVASSPADSPRHPQDRRARHRGRFGRTGNESVLDFIRRQGHPATAEVNRHWQAEGRRGTANVTLLVLLKEGKIRREADPSIRGSRYRIADQPATADPSVPAGSVR